MEAAPYSTTAPETENRASGKEKIIARSSMASYGSCEQGRGLPTEYGPWQTIATRFYHWVKAGVWSRVLQELQWQADATGELDWSLHHVDETVIRAHQHAAGA